MLILTQLCHLHLHSRNIIFELFVPELEVIRVDHPLDSERLLGPSNLSWRLVIVGEFGDNAIRPIALLIDLIGLGRYQCLVVFCALDTSAGLCSQSLSVGRFLR